jgi:hypothetical protein
MSGPRHRTPGRHGAPLDESPTTRHAPLPWRKTLAAGQPFSGSLPARW